MIASLLPWPHIDVLSGVLRIASAAMAGLDASTRQAALRDLLFSPREDVRYVHACPSSVLARMYCQLMRCPSYRRC